MLAVLYCDKIMQHQMKPHPNKLNITGLRRMMNGEGRARYKMVAQGNMNCIRSNSN